MELKQTLFLVYEVLLVMLLALNLWARLHHFYSS
jgi:hypothetical protein